MSELKPCPMCGATIAHLCKLPAMNNSWCYNVNCGNCGTRSMAWVEQSDAIAAWNRRANDAALALSERALRLACERMAFVGLCITNGKCLHPSEYNGIGVDEKVCSDCWHAHLTARAAQDAHKEPA